MPSTPAVEDEIHTRWPSLTTTVVIAVVLRLTVLASWVWGEHFEFGDLNYYWTKTGQLADVGMAETLREYPTPAAWLLTLPHVLGGGDRAAYATWFVIGLCLFDLAFCLMLWRRGGRARALGILLWSAFLPALGPLVWLRFDLIPAVLVGAAVVYAATHPRLAGAFLALGAAVKLWPAVLIPFLVEKRNKWGAVISFTVTGVLLMIVSVAWASMRRLVSPLTWQSDRGLQIESIWATPAMVARTLGEGWTVQLSPWQAFEIFGPGVSELLLASRLATYVGAALCLILVARHLLNAFRPGPATADPAYTGVVVLAVIGVIVLTNKTLSPQYLIWFAAPLAALVAQVGLRRTGSVLGPRRLFVWSFALMAIAGLSHAFYPALYPALYTGDPLGDERTVTATALLTARNVVLVGFCVDLLIVAFRATRASASREHTPDQLPSGISS